MLLSMELLVYTNENRNDTLQWLFESVIAENKLRRLHLRAACSNLDDVCARIETDRKYIVVIDTTVISNWKSVIIKLRQQFTFIGFCLISDDIRNAVESINNHYNLCGYIEENGNLYEQISNWLIQLCPYINTVCNGIVVVDAYSNRCVVAYDDIYYIETIKSLHECTVYHKSGTDIIRADISKLINHLDGRFAITRSSTIANLSLVRKMADGMLYFTDDIMCQVVNKRVKDVRKALQVYMVYVE